MNRTRWKMMIGALGLSLGGLAAVAGVPASDGMVSCSGAPAHTVARVSEPLAAGPKLADLPTLPGGPTIPLLPQRPIEVPAPTPPAVPLPAAPEPTPLPLPAPVPALPRIDPVKPAAPLPETPSLKPVAVPASVPSAKLVEVPPAAPKPAFAPPPKPDPVSARPTWTEFNVIESPAIGPVPTPPADAKVAERKLKVILSMGDERPRFEVRDGDEIYLKVVCDRVEVKSPGEAGVTVSTMSATGKVTFVTPGGEGTCDQLAVLPGTGQVVVTGKVTFTYNWGKVETTVTGEKMNFRLGSNTVTPTTAQGTPGVTGVPTSFTRPR